VVDAARIFLMQKRAFNKIFAIGMNKTGTKSLHYAFLRLGLRSMHHFPGTMNGVPVVGVTRAVVADRVDAEGRARIGAGEGLPAELEAYDAFTDIRAVDDHFRELDVRYPGSKFIYTERDTEDWIQSRTLHVELNRRDAAAGKYVGSWLEIEPDQWRRKKQEHWNRVQKYFADRPGDLLVMNIIAGDGYELLCGFLEMEAPAGPFPWMNSRFSDRS